MAGNDTSNSSGAGAAVQYVYLDFDGERTTYRNQSLRLSFSVSVRDPGFTDAQKQAILSGLKDKYASSGVEFTLSKPSGSYSTLYFGKSDSFNRYGDYYGVAETRDEGNKQSNDNAYVLLDKSYSTDQIVSVSGQVLDHILGNSYTVDASNELSRYAANTCLLSTEWGQNDPYNKYCPVDPSTKKRCVTGCTNTAVAQLIYYWMETGWLDFTLTLDSSDAYTRNNITISADPDDVSQYGYLSFSETNKLLSNFKLNSSDCIAALCFAAGVVQQASYSSTSTATPYVISLLTRSGFENSITEYYANESGSRYFKKNYGGLTDSGYNLLVKELLAGRPVLASLYYGSGKKEGQEEHAVVIDGFDSSTNKFHINFGWGERYNGWFSLDDLNDNYGIYDMFLGITPNTSPSLSIVNTAFKASAVNRNDDITLKFSIANQGKKKTGSVTATVYNGRKQVGSASVDSVSAGGSRSLSVTFNAASLSLGANTITVRAYSTGGGRIESVTKTVKVYDGAVTSTDDTWKKASAAGSWTKAVAVYDSEGQVAETVLAKDEYVGSCDPVDYREVTLDYAGKYTFALTGVNNTLEVNLYKLNSNNKLTLKKTLLIQSSSSGKISNAPLERGTYYISVRAVNADAHGDSDYALSFSGTGFMEADNHDDWEDLKENGARSTIPSVGVINADTKALVTDEWVGLGDKIDYRFFEIPDPARISFTLTATDAVKFTVYELREKKGKNDTVTYRLKTLQTKKVKAGATVDTKGLLLSFGDTPNKYCFSVQSTNASKGGSADYSVSFNSKDSQFYTKGDNTDDWGDCKGAGPSGAVGDVGAIVSGRTDVLEGWVGFCDAADYAKFTLGSAAKLSFRITASDAAKFRIFRLDPKTGKLDEVTYSRKTLQTTTLTKPKNGTEYAAVTKSLLLGEGTYYISVQSTNASKGGDADYIVVLNDDPDKTAFFTNGDDKTNDWLFRKKKNELNPAAASFASTEITAETTNIQMDTEKLVDAGGWNNFVGYDDEADYARIELTCDMTLSFLIKATDKAKFVIRKLTGTDTVKYSMKTLQTTTLTKQGAADYSATTKPISLTEGVYYISMHSTNASKGGNAYYNVTLNTAACVGLPVADDVLEAALDAPFEASLQSAPCVVSETSFVESSAGTENGILACLR